MSVRIEIKNFQSIDQETIDVDGFSALVGRSNIGKSAVIRAIKAALTGSSAESYVRHGAMCPRVVKGAKSCGCFCSVHIVGNGLDLLWEKGDTVNRYIHNGAEYTAVGRGTPEFLMKDFAPVKLGDERDIIQVADQFRPIFILDKPGTVAADILSDVAKLDQINVATRLVERDRKDAKAVRKVREKDVADLRVVLAGYDGLDGVVGRVAELEVLNSQIVNSHVKVAELERFIENIYSIGAQIRALKEVLLVEVPNIERLVDSGSAFLNLERLVTGLQARTEGVLVLDGVDVVELPDFEAFLVSAGAYDKFMSWGVKVELLRAFFERFQGLDLIRIPAFDLLLDIREKFSRFDFWASRLEELSRLLLRVKEEFQEIVKEESVISVEYESLGVCPYCNRYFTFEQKHLEI